MESIQVKICGLTNLTDAQAAVDAGADLLGFIFYPPSPRYISPPTARDILRGLRQGERPARAVGVFVNATRAEVTRALDDCGLDLAQLHGEEPPELLDELAGRAYKAIRPRSPAEARGLAVRYALEKHRPALLLDAYHPNLRGGTGHTGDWPAAAALAREFPLLLAGGLTPENVAQAIQAVRPWGVDVSSGVERAPGQKDHAALAALITAVRGAGG